MPLGLFGMELLTSTYCPNNPLGDMYVKTEAQMENSKLFMEMYNRYSNIAVTRYDWKNLPIGVNERLLNMSLYLVGKACFFEHEDYGLIALPCSNGSEYNLFYEPTRINAFSFGFTRILSFGEFELVRNNPTGTPTALTVYTYIKRMMDVLRSIDVVCARMKRPYLILCEEKQKLTFINLLKRIKDNLLSKTTALINLTLKLLRSRPLGTSTNCGKHTGRMKISCIPLLGLTARETTRKSVF